jgi:hypothetical protein
MDMLFTESHFPAESEPIRLRWSQRVAAIWAITWPCWLVTTLSLFALQNVSQIAFLQDPSRLVLTSNTLILLGQGLLAFRLVQKDFRSFWIGIVRDRAAPKRRMSVTEQIRVWLQLLFPQLAFIAALQLLSFVRLSSQAAQSVQWLVVWFRFLVVGPLSIHWAMMGTYPGFQLQAFRHIRARS